MTDHMSRKEQGMATRRKVLGDAHVDRAEATKTGCIISRALAANEITLKATLV